VDILMPAGFGKYKRHHHLFNALRRMPKSLRVVLMGQPAGARTAEVLLQEANHYGVRNRFQLLVSVPDTTWIDTLRRAKISLVLSRREGSCAAVTESLFANTPVGILADAEIGSRIFINPATGRLLKHRDLAGQLMDFLGEAHRYSPRQWAEQNKIGCFDSTQVLNDTLRKHALAAGQEWTQDIAAHHLRPDPQLVHPPDELRMQSAYADIEARFGIAIGMQGR